VTANPQQIAPSISKIKDCKPANMGKFVRAEQISADPQNKHWLNDKSTYGFKMLAKMGWTEGRGLGIKEDGATDYIKTKKNRERQGVGSTNNSKDNWLESSREFSNVLQNLNESYGLTVTEDQNNISKKRKKEGKERKSKKNKDRKRGSSR